MPARQPPNLLPWPETMAVDLPSDPTRNEYLEHDLETTVSYRASGLRPPARLLELQRLMQATPARRYCPDDRGLAFLNRPVNRLPTGPQCREAGRFDVSDPLLQTQCLLRGRVVQIR